jgi:hypothetical protein
MVFLSGRGHDQVGGGTAVPSGLPDRAGLTPDTFCLESRPVLHAVAQISR